jgi:hypothetical protein
LRSALSSIVNSSSPSQRPRCSRLAGLLGEARRELLEHRGREGELLGGGRVGRHQRAQRGGTGREHLDGAGARHPGLGAAQLGLQLEHLGVVGAHLVGALGVLGERGGAGGAGERTERGEGQRAAERGGRESDGMSVHISSIRRALPREKHPERSARKGKPADGGTAARINPHQTHDDPVAGNPAGVGRVCGR